MNERDELRTADLSPETPEGTRWSEDRGREQDRPDVDTPDLDAPRARTEPDAHAPDVDTSSATSVGPLLGADDAEAFRARWTDVQNGFVDEPRRAVEAADGLTAELMQHLAKTFADERGRLEHQWDRGDDVSTDDLRGAFQRYRSFFQRLLTA
jgi:hypothetical protein